ncbi:MAG: NUDIX hydrolase [Peptostreptococcaceae bacterium]
MLDNIKNTFKEFKPYINNHENMKKASVLIPIVKKDDTHHILFQVRSKNLKTQPNEISFPGGKIEKNETPLDAVIRETCEELGTVSDNIEIISPLDLFVHPADMIIHPFVGYIKSIDDLNINKNEVDHIFLVPIEYLLNQVPKSYDSEVKMVPFDDFPYDIIPNKRDYKFASTISPILFYEYKDYAIWGITSRILENFVNVKDLTPKINNLKLI